MNREKYRKQTWTEKKIIKCYFIRRRTCSPWWEATVFTTMQTLPPSPPRSISRTDFSLYQNHNIQPLVQGEHATVILFLNLRAPKNTFLFFPFQWFDVTLFGSVSELMCIFTFRLYVCLQREFLLMRMIRQPLKKNPWCRATGCWRNKVLELLLLCLVAQLCLTLCDPMDSSPPGPSVHGDSPGENTGMGCHALLQGILPTQGSNPGLPHCRQILYQLSHQDSWVGGYTPGCWNHLWFHFRIKRPGR